MNLPTDVSGILVLEAVRGAAQFSDIAVDDVTLTSGGTCNVVQPVRPGSRQIVQKHSNVAPTDMQKQRYCSQRSRCRTSIKLGQSLQRKWVWAESRPCQKLGDFKFSGDRKGGLASTRFYTRVLQWTLASNRRNRQLEHLGLSHSVNMPCLLFSAQHVVAQRNSKHTFTMSGG